MITRLGTQVGTTEEMRLRSGHRVGVSGPAAKIPTTAAEARALLMKDGTSGGWVSVAFEYPREGNVVVVPVIYTSTRDTNTGHTSKQRTSHRPSAAANADNRISISFPKMSTQKKPVTKMPDLHAPAFREGLQGLMNRWTALQLAILNEWGGSESVSKGVAMYEELEHWFLKRKAGKYAEDLEELLIEILGDDFCVLCEGTRCRAFPKSHRTSLPILVLRRDHYLWPYTSDPFFYLP